MIKKRAVSSFKSGFKLTFTQSLYLEFVAVRGCVTAIAFKFTSRFISRDSAAVYCSRRTSSLVLRRMRRDSHRPCRRLTTLLTRAPTSSAAIRGSDVGGNADSSKLGRSCSISSVGRAFCVAGFTFSCSLHLCSSVDDTTVDLC